MPQGAELRSVERQRCDTLMRSCYRIVRIVERARPFGGCLHRVIPSLLLWCQFAELMMVLLVITATFVVLLESA